MTMVDYSIPANDPVLLRAVWQITEFKFPDIAEILTRHEGSLGARAWAWTIRLKNNQYRSVACVVDYDPLTGWHYETTVSVESKPTKKRTVVA
jgi:hypothetical protein